MRLCRCPWDSAALEGGGMKKRETSQGTQRVWLWALVVYTGFIYFNSLVPASLSSQESGTLLETFHHFLVTVGNDGVWLTEHIIRKTAHFIEYAGLGCMICGYCRTWHRERAGRLRTAGELAFIIPFVDETIQLFVPGRSGQISDVWLDISGTVFGLILATLIVGWLQKRKN